MTKQQAYAFRPVVRKVERRLAPEILLIDTLWETLQYPFSIMCRPTEDGGTKCTVITICYMLVSSGV